MRCLQCGFVGEFVLGVLVHFTRQRVLFRTLIRAVVLFLASITSFVWRSALSQGRDGPKETFQEQLGPRVAISALLVLGLCYFIQLIGTFRRYGDLMDRIWRDRLLSKWTGTRPIYVMPPPSHPPQRPSPVQGFHPTPIIPGFRATDDWPSLQYPPYPWNETMQAPPRSPWRPPHVRQSFPTHMHSGFEPTHLQSQVEPSVSYPWNGPSPPSRNSSPHLVTIPSTVVPIQLESQQHETSCFKDPGDTPDRLTSGQPCCSPSPHHQDLKPLVDGNLTKGITELPSAKSHSEINSLQHEVAGVEAGTNDRTEDHIIDDPKTFEVHEEKRNSNLSLLELTIHEL